MSCRTFLRHLKLMDVMFLSEEGEWSRYFSAGPLGDYRQNEEEEIEELRFIDHFELCGECRRSYGKLKVVNSIIAVLTS